MFSALKLLIAQRGRSYRKSRWEQHHAWGLREEPNPHWAVAQAVLGRVFLGIVNLLDNDIRKDAQETTDREGPYVL